MRAAPALLLLAGCGSAHRPILTRPSCAGDFSSSAAALELPKPEISWAFSTYFTCDSTALWVKAAAWQADAPFYVGVGVPAIERFADARFYALVVGPELPALTADEVAQLPTFVKNDPAYEGKGFLHRAPDDQSTCSHLGAVMQEASSVKNGRCNFYEPFGRTDSWWVLDADNNMLPAPGGVYHVAVWPTQPVATKATVALGTWQENFFTPITKVEPGCAITLDDFAEKSGTQEECLPYRVCSADNSPVGCVAGTPAPPAPTAGVLDMNCVDEAGAAGYTVQMGCGGAACPRAAKMWDEVNTAMHMHMAVNWTGDVMQDFVYAMMPHHQGAVDMCHLLVNNLTCAGWGTPDQLDGLVHLCKDVQFWQTKEIAVMAAWLEGKGLPQRRMCAGMAEHMEHDDHGHGAWVLDGCGATNASGAKALIAAGKAMHDAMSVRISCEHPVDFVRMMAAHHQGGIAMTRALVDVLDEERRDMDPVLAELVRNITRAQYGEVAWMYEWLDGRDKAPIAPCEACADGNPAPPPVAPCEDLLTQTVFCHGVAQNVWSDADCLCAEFVKAHPCGTTVDKGSLGALDVSKMCKRTCQQCPARGPLFWGCNDDGHSGHEHGHNEMATDNKEHHHTAEGDALPVWGWALVAVGGLALVGVVVHMVLLRRTRTQAASFRNGHSDLGKPAQAAA